MYPWGLGTGHSPAKESLPLLGSMVGGEHGGRISSFVMAAESSSKRKREPESDDEMEEHWPRFLVMQTSSPNDDSLCKLSPFAIALGIKGAAGEPKSVRKISQGLLIEVTKRSHAENLLGLSTFVHIPVTVTPHRTLNSRKGVIRCRDLAGLSEEDICNGLSDQHVTHVKRIYVDRGQKATDTYILTFNITELPNAIKVGYLNIRVDIYIPNPLRCFKCQMYGHGSKHCNRMERCSRCGETHRSETCTAERPHCIHCKDEHAASDRSCPKYMREKLISKIKHSENISFQEARRRIETAQPSYASVVQAKVGLVPGSGPKPVTVSVCTQTELYWPLGKEQPSCDPPPPPKATTSTESQTNLDISRSRTPSAGHVSHGRSNSCGDCPRNSPSSQYQKERDNPIYLQNKFDALSSDNNEMEVVEDKSQTSNNSKGPGVKKKHQINRDSFKNIN